jgi:thiamine-phosphate pyrophosphorylase
MVDDNGAGHYRSGIMHGLYAIVDTGSLAALGIDPLAHARDVLRARPTALQLRAKDMPAREILSLLRRLHPMCRAAGCPLVVNDRPELAVLGGCNLVHVGQEDMPIDRVRSIAPTLGVGVSTHDLDQLARALETRPRYVAFGPVFETRSKLRPEPVVGIAGLRTAWAMATAAAIPLVAIGGITLERAYEVAPFCSAAAVISDLYAGSSEAVTARARAFHAVFGGQPPVVAAGAQA